MGTNFLPFLLSKWKKQQIPLIAAIQNMNIRPTISTSHGPLKGIPRTCQGQMQRDKHNPSFYHHSPYSLCPGTNIYANYFTLTVVLLIIHSLPFPFLLAHVSKVPTTARFPLLPFCILRLDPISHFPLTSSFLGIS